MWDWKKTSQYVFLRNNVIKEHAFLLNKSKWPFPQLGSEWGVPEQLCKEQWTQFNESEWRGNNALYSSNEILGIQIKKKKRWDELHRYLIIVFIKLLVFISNKLYRKLSTRITVLEAQWNALRNTILHLVCRHNPMCNSGKVRNSIESSICYNLMPVIKEP